MSKKPADERQRRQANVYMKYTGMAFQMAATIAIGIFAGKYLDRYFQTETPYFTILGAFIFAAAAMYLVIKDFLKN
ncbi:MAG TPA: AtpZ/AtpI family protein [Saprospiraceae bacterium]|nr:AtpZ/AtpI family protein [Saprospiraceae bacterium]HMP23826.1 AtpZ/AtpI family protein [Saprospiraceae bacterium]